jgi:phosphate:Na+ symporter
MVIGWLVKLFTGGVTFGSIFESAFPGAPQTQLAMFHTVFNVATVVLILPLTENLVRFVTRLIADDEVAADPDAPRFYHIDENMLKTPAVAARQTKKEVIGMGKLAMENFNRAMDMVVTLDFSDMQKFDKTEKELNFLNREIIDFIVRLSEKPSLSEYDMKYLNTAIRTVSDFERIGDYSENITEYAEHLARMNESFSDKAKEEIAELRRMVMELYDNAMEAYIYKDKHSLEKSYAIEDQIDDFTEKMENNHIQRLTDGLCSANVGSQYQALSSDTERIADHLINVGKSILRLGLITNFASQLA